MGVLGFWLGDKSKSNGLDQGGETGKGITT